MTVQLFSLDLHFRIRYFKFVVSNRLQGPSGHPLFHPLNTNIIIGKPKIRNILDSNYDA